MATPIFGVTLGPYTTNESHVRRCLPLQMARQPWWALVKYGNMHFTCTKGSKFLDHLSDYQLVKKASVRFGTVKKAWVCSDTTVGNAERQKTIAKTAVTHIGVTDAPHSTLRQLPSAILRSVCCTHSNRGDDVIKFCEPNVIRKGDTGITSTGITGTASQQLRIRLEVATTLQIKILA